MQKKLKLEEVMVKSFVTEFNQIHRDVKGGMAETFCTGVCCKVNIPEYTCECDSYYVCN